jgi:hypothetical protein
MPSSKFFASQKLSVIIDGHITVCFYPWSKLPSRLWIRCEAFPHIMWPNVNLTAERSSLTAWMRCKQNKAWDSISGKFSLQWTRLLQRRAAKLWTKLTTSYTNGILESVNCICTLSVICWICS